MIYLKPADLGFVRGPRPLSILIRAAARTAFEGKTIINHIFGVSRHGDLRVADIIESMNCIQEVNLYDEYNETEREVEIWRPLNITDEDREAIVYYARGFVGQKYPYRDLGLHFLDRIFFDTYFFRKFQSKKSMVCSRLWASAYGRQNLNFGGNPEEINPDDIHDFVRATEGQYYRQILSLGEI